MSFAAKTRRKTKKVVTLEPGTCCWVGTTGFTRSFFFWGGLLLLTNGSLSSQPCLTFDSGHSWVKSLGLSDTGDLQMAMEAGKMMKQWMEWVGQHQNGLVKNQYSYGWAHRSFMFDPQELIPRDHGNGAEKTMIRMVSTMKNMFLSIVIPPFAAYTLLFTARWSVRFTLDVAWLPSLGKRTQWWVESWLEK